MGRKLKFARWIFSTIIILTGLGNLGDGLRGIIGGTLFIVAGLILLLPIRDFIWSLSQNPLPDSKAMRAGTTVVVFAVLFLIGGSIIPPTETAQSPSEVEASTTTVTPSAATTQSSIDSTEIQTMEPASTMTEQPPTTSATSSPTPKNTATPTSTPTPVPETTVSFVNEDADGNDNENPNGEYVVLEHQGPEVDLSGWQISDEAGHSYTIPEGVSMADGDRLYIYSGSGQDSDTELYWGSGNAIWNNGGDTVTLENENGEVVDTYEYS